MSESTLIPDEAAPVAEPAPAQAQAEPATAIEPAAAPNPDVAAPPQGGILSEDGKLAEGWQKNLTRDHLRESKTLGLFGGDFEDLLDAFVQTKSMVGKKFERPADDASPEEKAKWKESLGAAPTADSYKELRPESIDQELYDQVIAPHEDAVKELFYKHDLTPQAAKEIVALYGDLEMQAIAGEAEAIEAEVEAATNDLRKTWGGEFDSKIQDAGKMAKLSGLDPFTHPAFRDPEVVKAFANLSNLFGESAPVSGTNITSTASQRASDIMDPTSNTMLAKEYRGEFGQAKQMAAQATLNNLLDASSQQS